MKINDVILESTYTVEGFGQDMAKLGGIAAAGIGAGLAGNYLDQQQPRVQIGDKQAYYIKNPGWGRVPDNAMTVTGKDGKEYKLWAQKGKGSTAWYATPAEKVKEDVAEDIDSYEFHTSVPIGDFLPSRHGKEKYLYLHDLTRKSGDGRGPMLVTVERPSTAVEIANEFGGRAVKTKLGTYRIVKDREGVEEGHRGQPWGDEGNFAGDTHVEVGRDTVTTLKPGDLVKYFGSLAYIDKINPDRDYARISFKNEYKTQNVRASDLQQIGGNI